jgi:nicotinamidase-related amidase
MAHEHNSQEYPALLIIDMVKDNFDADKNIPITYYAQQIIQPINQCIASFRRNDWPIVFATDSFHEDDFIFQGKLKPHSIAGTQGAEVIDELDRSADDLWLPKPRFSAFFKTDLADWLHKRKVTLCAVAGIATNYCVLTTVMDAVCHDFKAFLLEDCTAAASESAHSQTVDLFKRNPLYPLLRVETSQELINEIVSN